MILGNLSKLTPEEKAKYIQKNHCFCCREEGHSANYCPCFSPNPSLPHHISAATQVKGTHPELADLAYSAEYFEYLDYMEYSELVNYPDKLYYAEEIEKSSMYIGFLFNINDNNNNNLNLNIHKNSNNNLININMNNNIINDDYSLLFSIISQISNKLDINHTHNIPSPTHFTKSLTLDYLLIVKDKLCGYKAQFLIDLGA